MDQPLLLHSLATVRGLLLGCLDAAGARRVCEIGSETGGMTEILVERAERDEGWVWTVDPHPAAGLRRLAGQGAPLTIVRGLSPAALADVPACDAYLLDGDHNHHVVAGELREIAARAPGALVVVHDCGWPFARRDAYYQPEALPAGGAQPHAFDRGVAPGEAGLVDGGLRGQGSFAIAEREGGPRNGVLTAVEDHLAEHEELAFALVPSVFGVGIAYPRDAEWAPAVAELLRPWDRSELLALLERNRIDLYLRVLALQDELARAAARNDRVIADYERRAAADSAELAALRLSRAREQERAGSAAGGT